MLSEVQQYCLQAPNQWFVQFGILVRPCSWLVELGAVPYQDKSPTNYDMTQRVTSYAEQTRLVRLYEYLLFDH